MIHIREALYMIANLDVFLAATVLVEKYGAAAAIQAAKRADEFLEEGNLAVAGAWWTVFAAVELLQRGRQGGDALN
jgi:hypothetical protein